MTVTHHADSPASTTEEPPFAAMKATFERLRRASRAHTPSAEERQGWLSRLERTLIKRQEAIANAISQDFGSRSRHETLMAEVLLTVEECRHARNNLAAWMKPRPRPVHWACRPAHAELLPQPLGVVGVIAPWNYPVNLCFGPAVGALAAGNRVLFKPSELTPTTSALLEDLVAETFEPDVAQVLTGGPEVAEAFSRLPLDHLVFTGSTRVGKIIMRAAAENLVPVTLELGGKSPALVAGDYPLEDAAARIAAGKLFNAGQTCIAPDYVLVPAGRERAFVDALQKAVAKMYPRMVDNPDYSTIVSDRHLARLRTLVEEARAGGAEVLELNPGGESAPETSRKFLPTVLLGVRDDMAVMQEELFGPVLPVLGYGTLDDALAAVNDRPRPLAFYVFSRDSTVVQRAVEGTVSGGVVVNDVVLHFAQPDLPFGGVGPSGMGAYHGEKGFETFSMLKPVFHQSRFSATPYRSPPYGAVVDGYLKLVLRR
ncbi:MAG: coniferyl aldehyde dehydrogenase [Deltaproteobacteria bacterium]|nr:coniferyl aldehyde dehydrogenase [Deltaproteobacteria bacterium]